MGCKHCPEPSPIKNNAWLVYTSGPPDAQFTMLAHVRPQEDGTDRLYKLPTVSAEGRLEYPADSPVPPEMEGFERQSENPRVLVPIWPACSCAQRMYRVGRAAEGYLFVAGICVQPTSEHVDHEVTMETCKKCPVRVPIPAGLARRQMRELKGA